MVASFELTRVSLRQWFVSAASTVSYMSGRNDWLASLIDKRGLSCHSRRSPPDEGPK